MHPVLKRIVVNGLLTAAMLAVVGIGYGQLAGMYLASGTSNRGAGLPGASQPAADADSLGYRVPLTMALWGFVVIVVLEGTLYWCRGNRPVAAAAKSPASAPDPTQVLLDQLILAEEAKAKEAAPASSPSTIPAENSPHI